MQIDRSRFLSNFKEEMETHLSLLDRGVLDIEKGEWNEDSMKKFMRSAHSMKGSARMMGFSFISDLAHKIEDVIGAVRDGRIEADEGVIDALFAGLDCIAVIVKKVIEGGNEEEHACREIFDRLANLTNGDEAVSSELVKEPAKSSTVQSQPPPAEKKETPAPTQKQQIIKTPPPPMTSPMTSSATQSPTKKQIHPPLQPETASFDASQFLGIFKEEAGQHLSILNQGILDIEKGTCDDATMENLMRVAHSLKGTANMLGLGRISELLHGIEDVLTGIKKSDITGGGDVADVLFAGLDGVELAIKKETKGEKDYSTDDLVKNLQNALKKNDKAEAAIKDDTGNVLKPEIEKEIIPEKKAGAWGTGSADHTTESKPVAKAETKPTAAAEAEKNAAPATDKKSGISEKPSIEANASQQKISQKEVSQQKASQPDATAWAVHADPAKPQSQQSTAAPVVEETIRVKTAKLDKLVNLIEEMILNQRENEERDEELRLILQIGKQLKAVWNSVMPTLRSSDETMRQIAQVDILLRQVGEKVTKTFKSSKNTTSHSRLIMQELQQDVMEMRMLPLSTIFDAYPRAVRDLAKQFGKQIHFTIKGADTPLDKTIIEEISDPMIHLIRNAVDHGQESTVERIAAGKSKYGNITLSATQRGDQVVITIEDDGKGIDAEAVKSKAIKTGLLDKEKANSYTDKEIIYLILEPGFSLKKTVTDISGRGVGMDVVKKAVEGAKGQILIDTVPGKGSRFSIKLPLALAISRALLVKAAGETFSIPTTSVRETLRIKPDEIQSVVDKKAIRLRGKTISITKLSNLLKLKNRDAFPGYDSYPVVIVEAIEQQLGIIVDEILEEQEIVLKGLGEHLKNIRTVAGATILGGGEVVIVLRASHLVEIAREQTHPDLEWSDNKKEKTAEFKKKRILIVEDSFNVREMEKIILEAAGYQVDTAANGREGVESALKNKYDLVLTDIAMPYMNGFEMIKKLKSAEEYKNIPFVISTSLESEEDKKKGMEAGASAYLTKSMFNQTTFIDTISSYLL